MPKRSFRYDPTLKEMVEVTYVDSGYSNSPMVHGDIPRFWSPVDGTFVEGRRQYEEHNKRNNVVPFEPGDEKQRPQKESPKARQELRERLWEFADKAIQRGPNRRIGN